VSGNQNIQSRGEVKNKQGKSGEKGLKGGGWVKKILLNSCLEGGDGGGKKKKLKKKKKLGSFIERGKRAFGGQRGCNRGKKNQQGGIERTHEIGVPEKGGKKARKVVSGPSLYWARKKSKKMGHGGKKGNAAVGGGGKKNLRRGN